MKAILTILATFALTAAVAQGTKPSTKTARPKSEKTTAVKSKPNKNNTSGKSDPYEKGSGMTVQQKDKPKLDGKPEPRTEPIPAKNP